MYRIWINEGDVVCLSSFCGWFAWFSLQTCLNNNIHFFLANTDNSASFKRKLSFKTSTADEFANIWQSKFPCLRHWRLGERDLFRLPYKTLPYSFLKVPNIYDQPNGTGSFNISFGKFIVSVESTFVNQVFCCFCWGFCPVIVGSLT